jgi:hypothetical protein
MRSPRQLHHERSVRTVLDNRLETEHAEYDPVTYENITVYSDSIHVELGPFFRRI